MINKNKNGFTLIELVIVIVLIGIIGSMAATMLFQGADLFVKETNRQGFVSESRIAFWKIMRESQAQSGAVDFVQSNQNSLYLKNAKNITKDFQLASSGNFNIRVGNGSYNSLSNSLSSTNTNGFYFYDDNYNLISPPISGMSSNQANNVHMMRLELEFIKDQDEISLSSFIYPKNFRFGKKMSYHN